METVANLATRLTANAHEARGVSLLTNHAHVLILLAKDDSMTMRDIAGIVGITERAVQRIIEDLAANGILGITKKGRCNHYVIHPENRLQHPVEALSRVGDILRCALPHYPLA